MQPPRSAGAGGDGAPQLQRLPCSDQLARTRGINFQNPPPFAGYPQSPSDNSGVGTQNAGCSRRALPGRAATERRSYSGFRAATSLPELAASTFKIHLPSLDTLRAPVITAASARKTPDAAAALCRGGRRRSAAATAASVQRPACQNSRHQLSKSTSPRWIPSEPQ